MGRFLVEFEATAILHAGAQADTVCFTEYVQKNMALYEISNGLKLSTPAAASFVRNELAVALRKGPYQTNLLLGGYDAGTRRHIVLPGLPRVEQQGELRLPRVRFFVRPLDLRPGVDAGHE